MRGKKKLWSALRLQYFTVSSDPSYLEPTSDEMTGEKSG